MARYGLVAPEKLSTLATDTSSIELDRTDFELPWYWKPSFSYDAIIDCSSFLACGPQG
jgi:hypothetical protein